MTPAVATSEGGLADEQAAMSRAMRGAALNVRVTEIELSDAESHARILLRLDELARERQRLRSITSDRPRWAQLAGAVQLQAPTTGACVRS